MSAIRLARLARPCIPRTARPIIPRAALRPCVRYYSDTKTENPKDETQTEAQSEAKTEPSEPTELEVLKEKLAAKDSEVAQFKDLYARSVADFRNLQSTTKREVQNARDFAIQKFAKDLVESVDNFDRALSVISEEQRSHELVKPLYDGIKMTQDIFEKTLARHGLQKLHPLGEQFDPNLHEAVFQAPQDGKTEPGTIMHVQQTGFTLNGRVLRAPKVGIIRHEE